MDEKIVLEIKDYLVSKLNDEFGFCGVAEGDKNIMINSGKENIIINIKWD